jgi:hypothetical protein
MKKTILALALLGTGASGWAQNTTGTNSSTTPNSNTTTTTTSPTGTDLNGTSGNTQLNGTTPPGTTSSQVNPGNSNTTGTLQSSTTAGVDYNTMQNTPNGNTQVTLQSNSNYAAYGNTLAVPGNLQTSFQKDYPTAFNPSWQQSGDWYRASFNNQNRNVMVYYAPNGNSYSVALPVLNGYIPEEVITKSLSMYNNSLYSITRVKAANGQDAYQVSLIDGGVARTEFIGEDGTSFAAIDVFRHDDAEMANGELQTSSSNAANAESTPATTTPVTTDGSSSDMNSGNNTISNSTSTDATTAPAVNSTDNTNSSISTDATTSPALNSTGDQDVKYKHKVKTDDGKKLKIKTKNGATKVKGDAMDASGGNQ